MSAVLRCNGAAEAVVYMGRVGRERKGSGGACVDGGVGCRAACGEQSLLLLPVQRTETRIEKVRPGPQE